MEKYKKRTLLVLSLVYGIIFWKENLGLNLILFGTLLLALLYTANANAFKRTPVKVAAAGLVISGIAVLLFNSFISKFAHLVSFGILLGFIHHETTRSVQNAIQYVAMNQLLFIRNLRNDVAATHPQTARAKPFFVFIKLFLVPVIVLFIFYMLFYFANPKFANLASVFWTNVFDVLGNVFEYISFGWLLFVLSGFLLLGGVLYKSHILHVKEYDALASDELKRARAKRRDRVFNGMNILKNEYLTGVILVALVNALLLLVNAIDISWIWINFSVPEGMVLKHFVHEGTYLLILSILLSMGIILYFFRNNLNFYPNNKLLKKLSYLWMFQNMILVVSVCLRNYHYINYHGLAYKRIGVIIFLMLTLVGLVTMMIKIAKVRSPYYLFTQNLWAAFVMMIVMSCIDWDVLIAKFNLAHWNKQGVDVGFYFTLSPKVMPYVYEQLDVVEEQIDACNKAQTNYTVYGSIADFKRALANRKVAYLREQETRSWLSWNASDQCTVNAFILR